MPAKKDAHTSKPTYAVMVTESIRAINDRTGSSLQAITKQLQSHYNIDINRPALLKAIKKGVEAGDFVQIKASYKLSPKSNLKKKVATTTTTTTKKKAPVKTITRKTQTTTTSTKKAASGPKKTITKRTKAKTSTTSTRKAAAKKDMPKRSTTSTRRKASTKK